MPNQWPIFNVAFHETNDNTLFLIRVFQISGQCIQLSDNFKAASTAVVTERHSIV